MVSGLLILPDLPWDVAFAAARGARLDAADKELRPLIAKALAKDDSTSWGDIADAAGVLWLELFEKSAPKAYQDAALARFRKEILASLGKTSKPSDPPTDAEIDRVTNWVSSYTSNNATFQGAYAVGQRQKQWVTRHDDKVRHSHQRVDGQRVSMSGTFDVDGNKLRYPGEPVGPPDVWINCRCLVVGVGKKTAMSKLTAAASDVDTSKTAVVVALPKKTHPVNGISTEEDGAHMTLAFLGDPSTFDLNAVKQHVAAVAAGSKPFVDKVSGRGTLGPNKADVQLMNGDGSVPMRNSLLDDSDADVKGGDEQTALNPVKQAHDAVEQYPTFTPHVTLGYPEAPANGTPDFDEIPFDRLAVWAGNDDHTEYPLGQPAAAPANGVTAAVDVPDMDDSDTSDFVDADMPIPFHGVAAPVGVMSGDGRRFTDPAGISFRRLPLPFKYQPMTAEGHDYAVNVGRVDTIWVDPADNLIKYEGVFNSSIDAQTVIEGIVFGDISSVSVDLGAAELDFDGSDTLNGKPVTDFSAVQIAGITAVSVGAFEQAFIALGTWADDCGCNGEDPNHAGEAPTDDTDSDDTVSDEEQSLAELISFLEEMGVEVVTAAGSIDEGKWDGSAENYTPEQWKAACILHLSNSPIKTDHKLPIKTPTGTLSRAGVHAAASRFGSVDAPAAAKASAKASLRSAYKQLGEDVPDSLTASAAVIDHIAELVASGVVFAPGTHDGPGWVTNPRATERIRNYWVHGEGAAKIRWGVPGDFNRCRKQLAKYVQNPEWLAGLCANMHKEAIAVWPGQEDGGRGHHHVTASGEVIVAPAVTFLEASGVSKKPASWFAQPDLDRPTQLTISDTGRIYGHLAAWGVCHIGMPGTCTEPPHSATNYAYFHTGQIETDEGLASVGHFTRGIGHAGGGISMAQATAHYDHTDSIWADVAVGEDEFGIWFAGAIRDDVTAEEVAELRADGALSGDWRGPSQDRLELVAAVAVGTPGFPIPRTSIMASGGVQTSLTAAGIVTETVDLEEPKVPTPLDLQNQLALIRATADEVEFRMARRARITAMRDSEREKRLAKLAMLRKEMA